MTQTRLSERSGLWNDTHMVPAAFYIFRTGYIFHAHRRVALTFGYAYLGLPVPEGVTRDFKRTEHRPWAQVVHSVPINDAITYVQRFRYDARIRRNVASGQLAPGFGLTQRFRFMTSLRVAMPKATFGDGWLPYVSVANELLLQAAATPGPAVDQNRVSAMFGLAWRRFAVQLGYMNRLVRVPQRTWVMNHTPVLWVFQTFDLRRSAAPLDEIDPEPGP